MNFNLGKLFIAGDGHRKPRADSQENGLVLQSHILAFADANRVVLYSASLSLFEAHQSKSRPSHGYPTEIETA